MSIKAIAKGNRKKGDKETLPILIQSVDVENTVDAQVACDHNISDGDTVYIDFEGGDKSRPIIVGVLYGQTEADALDDGDKNGNYDPSDPNASLLACGSSLADLAVVIVSWGERSGTTYSATISKLDENLPSMLKQEWYATVSDADGKSIGIRQWTGNSGRAKPIYEAICKDQGKSGKLSDNNSTISTNISTSEGIDAQWEIARDGKLNGKKVDPSGGLCNYIQDAIKGGIKDNACILYYCDMCNQTPARGKKMIAGYKKGMKLKEFYKDVCLPIDSNANVPCPARRKAVYQNIKLMEDAGWLKGSAGNLTNLADNGSDNEKTGWGYPIEDKEGKFYISEKFNDKNKYCIISHKKKKNEGKTVLAMYKGKVKEVSKDSGLVTMVLETKEDNAKKNGKRKHYVQYMGLKSINVKKGDNVKKEQAIGKLGSEGLTLTVHKTKNSESTKVDPSIYIGTNPSGVAVNSPDVKKVKEVKLDKRMNWLFPNGTPTNSGTMSKWLTSITVPLYDNGKVTKTSIQIHKKVAKAVEAAFKGMVELKFPVHSVGTYCWRMMNGNSSSRSHHSYGIAIDINAGENGGSFWQSKTDSKYYIPKRKDVVKLWKECGFYWGGDWSSPDDPMHFSYTNH